MADLNGAVYSTASNNVLLTMPGTITNKVVNSPFMNRDPKPDSIKAVKLTAENFKDVAAYILKTVGGNVRAEDDQIYVEGIYLARVGYWVIETYDYLTDAPLFTMARIADREKYDLR